MSREIFANINVSQGEYQPQDVFESNIARTVLAAAWRTSPDAVDTVAGVKTVTPYWERPDGEDCTGFVFGPDADPLATTEEIVNTWHRHTTPIPGATAIYLYENVPTHVGLVLENGRVLSKWSTNLFESGHVYEHLPLAVPKDYGDRVIFFLPQESLTQE